MTRFAIQILEPFLGIDLAAPQRYEFKPKAKAPRLQRLLFWALGKLGAVSDPTYKVEFRDPTGEGFMLKFGQQIEQQWNVLGRPPQELIIGMEDYNALMREGGSFAFEFHSSLRVAKPRNSRYMNYDLEGWTEHPIRVRVVPQMRGWVLL